MLLKRFLSVALCLALTKTLAIQVFANTSEASWNNNWELKHTHDGLNIQIYVRDVAGSSIKEFKGVTYLQSSLNSSVALINDTKNMPNWISSMDSIRVLKKINANETYAYSVNKTAPFMENRDTVVYSVLTQDPTSKVVTITLEGKPSYIPPTEDAIRVTRLKGLWKITPHSNGTVEVVYQLHVDPSGNVPQSMFNSYIVKSSLETLAEMHTEIEKYQDIKLAYIME